MARTLYDKLWDAHVIRQQPGGPGLLYVDRHLLHEVSSPPAFEGLGVAGRRPWRVDANLAVADHNVPTTNRNQVLGIPSRVCRWILWMATANGTASPSFA